MDKKHRNRKWPAIIGVIFVIIAAGISLFFYHNFFRQTHGQLVETVPPDAMYILQINDNETFVKSSTQLLPYLNDILSLDALPGFEFFMDKFPSQKTGIIISCHQSGDQKKLLFSSKISESMFKELLKILKIDGRNFLPFDNAKIYSYGTHYKKYNFTFHNNFFTVSEDIELLKKSIVQLKHPRNLLSNNEFSELFNNIVSKNSRQNWLIINNKNYFEDLKVFLADPYKNYFSFLADVSEWSAFHIRFHDREIFLSGYAPNRSPFFQRFENQKSGSETPVQIIPFSSPLYVAIRTPNPQLYADQYVSSSKQEESIAIKSFRQISPPASYYFYIEKDSVSLHYLALEIDSNLAGMLTPNDSAQTDSQPNNTIFSIRKCDLGNFNEMLSIVHQKSSMNYFTEYNGYYIFSDTITSLEYYLNEIQKSNYGKQPLYRFVKANIPSHNNFEFSLILPDAEKQRHFLTEESSSVAFVRGLQIFSYAFSAPEKGFVPINVYLKLR